MTEAFKINSAALLESIAEEHSDAPMNLRVLLRRIESDMVALAMHHAKDNCTRAAHLLGIKRTTLVMKREKLAMPMRDRRAGT